MIKLSGNLIEALSTLPESSNLEIDLSDCVTGSNVLHTKKLFQLLFNKRVVSLILPDAIEEIRLDSNTNPNIMYLRKIIGKNVLYIRNYAFCKCESLESIDFPNVISIGDFAFHGCKSLKYINLPNVKSISNGVFSYCESLKSIDLPKMHEVNYSVFENCKSLETINLYRQHIEEFIPEVCGELFD